MSDGNLTFQVQSTVRVQESGHLVNPGKHAREELQATIRACLRELDAEREAVRAAAGRSERLLHREEAETLRSLLPETEGEA